MADALAAPARLDLTQKQKTSYAVEMWRRDEQIRLNIAATPNRIEPHPVRSAPIAVVCYGPSLAETWEQIRDFEYVISCSGAHKFLIERGIVPNFHIDVDPRIHKMALIGEPHPDVEYLLAATCHPTYVQKLVDGGFKVRLWHVFDNDAEARRVLPQGEWALTGGCSVGLRALAIARFLGFTELDVFGMDGSEGKTGKHADAHPNQAKQSQEVEHEGVIYLTTPGFLEAARTTPHEMDALADVTARFHGEGLVQAIMRDYRRTVTDASLIAFNKPELISAEYRRLNAQLHRDNLAYGVGAGRHAETVKKIVLTLKTADGMPPSVLDYGCGKGYMRKALSFPIDEYDPAIPGKDESPRPADLVCCLDVLEHIEPEKLSDVLDDLRRCVKQTGYFVIHTAAAKKTLPDGRNTHLIQEGKEWWADRLARYFYVGKIIEKGKELHVIVGPKPKAAKKAKPQSVSLSVVQPSYALDFSGLTFRRDPYVIGGTQRAMSDEAYRALSESFPDIGLFKSFGEHNRKWSLSSVNNPDAYAKFLSESAPWRAFHAYIKHDFIEHIAGVLKEHDVAWRNVPMSQLKARWEFSLLPADGGCLRPHTDIPSKLVTVVLSMRPLDDETWQPEWGGGTDVLVPKPGSPSLDDYKADYSAFDVVHTYGYEPNQAVVFIKAKASWHSVGPLAGPAGALRKSITVNIERAL